jgi:putative methyltransferase (TIGR04325 family)
VARGLTPPYVWRALQWSRDIAAGRAVAEQSAGDPPRTAKADWEYVPEGWARQASDPAVKGWNVAAIADTYRRKWPSFVRAIEGPGPLGVAHDVPADMDVPRDERGAHHTIMAYGYALTLASRQSVRVSVLDWGGGPGHYYLLSRVLVPAVEFDYHCEDVPHLVALGRELVPQVSFSSDRSCLDQKYDFVFASGSFQYAEDWRQTLKDLAKATAGYLFITRLPISRQARSFVVLQRPYRYGYDTEYLGWVIGRDELLVESARANMELVREFVLDDLLFAAGAPENPTEHRAYLFRPASRA